MNYKPLHIYHQTLSQKTQTRNSFTGNDSLLNVKRGRGFYTPSTTNKELNMETLTTTGKLKKNEFPIELEILSLTNRKGEAIIPSGCKLLGTVIPDSLPVFASIKSDKMEKTDKASILKSIQNLLSNISFPDKKMGIGEEYTKKTSLSIPVNDQDIGLNLSTIYKLTSVSDSTANFEIKLSYSVDTTTSNFSQPFSASGGGNGSLVYDRKNEFFLSQDLHFMLSASATNDEKITTIVTTSSDATVICNIQEK